MDIKRLPLIPVLCYLLLVVAWIVDQLTPQLFVAAILLNGPIALSGLALNTRLTAYLVVAAEIANIIAGYSNGLPTEHWSSAALGDRLLAAASFLLVGYLTVRAQEYARDAGSATERASIAVGEKALRRSLEAVRATLNVELVQRAIAREARRLFDADEAQLIVRSSALDLPDIYTIDRESPDVRLERTALGPATSSIIERVNEDARAIREGEGDPVGSMILEAHKVKTALGVRLRSSQNATVLFLFAPQYWRNAERTLQAFADGCSVALDQAQLFMQLGYRNEQIAAQRDALERSTKVIRDIVYALAHDLRTPLAATNLTMQQAIDGKYGQLPEQYRTILKTTLASNQDVRRLVDTLLLVARFESGETSSRLEPVHLDSEVCRVLEELKPIAEVKGVTLRSDGDDATVDGDDIELRRAITNLTANAIEATPKSGTVAVHVSRTGGEVRVAVEDDGYGIPPERRAQLFERFGSVDRPAGAGSGLGLYIVRLIAQKYGGTVTYSPRDPRGSIFTIALPAVHHQ